MRHAQVAGRTRDELSTRCGRGPPLLRGHAAKGQRCPYGVRGPPVEYPAHRVRRSRPRVPTNRICRSISPSERSGGLVLAIGCVMLQEQNTSRLHSPGEAGTIWRCRNSEPYPTMGAWQALESCLSNSRQRKTQRRKGRAGASSLRICRSPSAAPWRPFSRRAYGDHPRTAWWSQVRGRRKARPRWSAILASPLPKPAARCC